MTQEEMQKQIESMLPTPQQIVDSLDKTLEEKAKAYNEALERAKAIYQGNYKPDIAATIAETLQNVFPELRKSEDEKTREEIINYFKCQSRDEPSRKDIHNKWIAWLEKQGELPIEKLPEEMKTVGESLGFTTQEECDEYNQMVSDLIMSDDNEDEQKPALNEGDEKTIKDLLNFLKSPFINDNICDWKTAPWIAWLEKQVKTSTEDFGELINILSKQFPEVSFAKLSRIAVRVKKWVEKQGEQKSNDKV